MSLLHPLFKSTRGGLIAGSCHPWTLVNKLWANRERFSYQNKIFWTVVNDSVIKHMITYMKCLYNLYRENMADMGVDKLVQMYS